ncbi:MAG: ion transporter [Burkholderiales bacterium]
MARRPNELKNTGYEIFVGMLSVLSIVNLVFVYAFVKDPNMQQILQVMNALFSVIFIGDFTYRIITAHSKSGYFFRQFGWADLLSSLPFPQFKVLRVIRLFRVYRLMRDIGPKNVVRALVKDRAGSALFTLLLAGILVLEFGSLAILRVEQYTPGANITSANVALWYVIVTISTVGYGDHYPITNAGYVIGSLIIVVGVGIFGTFTGYLANFFLSPAKAKADAEQGEGATDDARTRLEQLKVLMTQQQSLVDGIESQLERKAG